MKKEKEKETVTMPSRATMLGVPGDVARRRGLQNILVPLVCLGFMMGLGLGLLMGGFHLLPWWVGFLLLGLTFVALGGFYQSMPRRGYSYFKGARGEEMIASELSHLPSTWTIFNGLILPNGRDVDHVAVGPQGIFVIETKHWRGTVEIDQHQLLANGRALPVERSPILQVRRSVMGLAAALQMDAKEIQGMICFAGTQFVNGAQTLDEIVLCSHLQLEAYLRGRAVRFDDASLARVIATLNTLTITEGLS
ncbi:MAG: nuclease-related domain-containing protein [bacterium]|nr:nuclease-related domain-containing protein [bacterium]